MAPRAINYKSNSIIYFPGDNADSVYLLKEGKINLIYNDIETGAEITDSISAGEFFGVKSGLIRFAREETAQTIATSTVIEFSSPEFEALITKNTSIILKMLKVFSTQLRHVHRQVQDIVGSKSQSNPVNDLFQIGNYYLKNKKYKQSITVFQRYIKYFPDSEFTKLAKTRLKLAQDSLAAYGEGGGPTPNLEDVQMKSKGDQINPNDLPANYKYGSEEEKVYYKGVNLISQGKYNDAFAELKKLMMLGNDEYKTLGFFEIGKCLFLMGKFSECIQNFSDFLKKYPNYKDTPEVYFYIGNAYQKIGNKPQAIEFYKKVIASTMENNNINRKAQKALKEIG
jgi:TolA-binding protein